jgi:serine/threonine protein phosphatase PrpC
VTTGAHAAQGRHHAVDDIPTTTVPQHAVGDPGRAPSRVRPRLDSRFPFRPSVAADQVRITAGRGGPELELRAASVRGLAHRYYGTTRQDAYGFIVSDDNQWLVLAVADGVSAGERSHLAAETAAQVGCQLLVEQLAHGALDWPGLLSTLAAEITAIGGHEADADPVRVAEDLATTALFAVLGLRDDVPTTVYAFGDSSAWLLRPSQPETWTPLQAVKNAGAAIASPATKALPLLPSNGGFPEPASFTLPPDAVLVLMSDGVADPLGSGQGEVADFLAGVWAEPPDPYSFAAQVDFARRTFDDDRTVIAVWPAG